MTWIVLDSGQSDDSKKSIFTYSDEIHLDVQTLITKSYKFDLRINKMNVHIIEEMDLSHL